MVSGNTSPLRSEERADYATTEAGYDADWSGPASVATEAEPFSYLAGDANSNIILHA